MYKKLAITSLVSRGFVAKVPARIQEKDVNLYKINKRGILMLRRILLEAKRREVVDGETN